MDKIISKSEIVSREADDTHQHMIQMIQCFSTIKSSLEWLTQKTEELKSSKGTLLFPHTE